MAVILSELLVLANAGSGWLDVLFESRAPVLSLVGLSAVFAGLVLLYVYMRLLAFFAGGQWSVFVRSMLHRPKPVEVVDEAEAEVVEGAEEDELERAALTGPLLLRAADLAVAQVVRTLYRAGKFPLGEEREVSVDGKVQTVKLVTVGMATTAVVNDRKVVFYRSHTAGSAAKE